MAIKKTNVFEDYDKYCLFRTVREIIHPTISKKNISNYRIILHEDLFPVRVFYPKKVSNIKNTIIFIHGDHLVSECSGKYSSICKNIALDTDQLIIAIDYEIEKKKDYKKLYEKIYKMVKYLYNELEKNSILSENITIMGDSTGANICSALSIMAKERKEFIISKQIVFYGTYSLEYFGKTSYDSLKNNSNNQNLLGNLKTYFTNLAYKKDFKDKYLNPFQEKDFNELPKTLIFVAKSDILKDENYEYYKRLYEVDKESKFVELTFVDHGFLKNQDKEVSNTIIKNIKEFIN